MTGARSIAAAFLTIFAVEASAGEFGRPAPQVACETDIHRLCEDVYPDVKLVAACLVDQRSRLSTSCAEQLAHPEADDADEE